MILCNQHQNYVLNIVMQMRKRLLLGSAAGLFAVSGAQAADLPVKARPVEYVKICTLYGDGYYYIPGSDTCLKVGGNVWVEGMYLQPYTKAQDQLGYRTNLTVSLDARTNTEYGLLRTVVAPQIAKRNGLEIAPANYITVSMALCL